MPSVPVKHSHDTSPAHLVTEYTQGMHALVAASESFNSWACVDSMASATVAVPHGVISSDDQSD